MQKLKFFVPLVVIGMSLSLSNCAKTEHSSSKVSSANQIEPATGVVAAKLALPAGTALMPTNLVYVTPDPAAKIASDVFFDKTALTGAVIAKDLPAGTFISSSDIAQISGSPTKTSDQDIIVSTQDIEAGDKLNESNIGYWKPTPNYRPLTVQMALKNAKDAIGCEATVSIAKDQIITNTSVKPKK